MKKFLKMHLNDHNFNQNVGCVSKLRTNWLKVIMMRQMRMERFTKCVTY